LATERVEDRLLYGDFVIWFSRRIKLRTPSLADGLIKEAGSEELAFEKFFEYFDAFLLTRQAS